MYEPTSPHDGQAFETHDPDSVQEGTTIFPSYDPGPTNKILFDPDVKLSRGEITDFLKGLALSFEGSTQEIQEFKNRWGSAAKHFHRVTD
jgi:hypothetical protein